jgi:hypothetical protein
MANNVQFGQYGWNSRPKRRLYIVNGSKLVTAEKQQAFLPFTGTILSGQPVARVFNNSTDQFQLANATSEMVYFANADSEDWDVKACGKLPAIYSGDDFEIQTPFFDEEQTYTAGDKLYIKVGANGPVVTKEEGNGPVVGIVSKGVINLGAANEGSIGLGFVAGSVQNTDPYTYANAHTGVSATTVQNGAIAGGPRAWTNDTGSQYVLQFYTKYIPAAAATTEG